MKHNKHKIVAAILGTTLALGIGAVVIPKKPTLIDVSSKRQYFYMFKSLTDPKKEIETEITLSEYQNQHPNPPVGYKYYGAYGRYKDLADNEFILDGDTLRIKFPNRREIFLSAKKFHISKKGGLTVSPDPMGVQIKNGRLAGTLPADLPISVTASK